MKKKKVVIGLTLLLLSGVMHGAANSIYSDTKSVSALLIVFAVVATLLGIAGIAVWLNYEFEQMGTNAGEMFKRITGRFKHEQKQ